ncbi:MAG: ribulose-phosphate 3-epimerase, partial [Clostridia bacterium]|nr:ribulose-phosphate 3-epimerase [Clostridia bacterium]
IKKARKMLDDAGRTDVVLEVDGNCSFENIPKMYEAGADVFVVGTSSVFHKDYTYETAVEKVLKSLE